MNHVIKKALRSAALLTAALVLFPVLAYANTDGSEIQITDQPDRLILQLGPQWAGVEFELKTDAGVFPVPVIVDSTGVLKMDLGGSNTYTLSCLAGNVTNQLPGPPTEDAPAFADEPLGGNGDTGMADSLKEGIPVLHLVLFLGGLAVTAGGLLAMRYFKRRRETAEYSDDYGEDD